MTLARCINELKSWHQCLSRHNRQMSHHQINSKNNVSASMLRLQYQLLSRLKCQLLPLLLLQFGWVFHHRHRILCQNSVRILQIVALLQLLAAAFAVAIIWLTPERCLSFPDFFAIHLSHATPSSLDFWQSYLMVWIFDSPTWSDSQFLSLPPAFPICKWSYAEALA